MNQKSHKPFHFKQFTLYQEFAAMKIGTDGILLGAWANCQDCKHMIDVGTGTGVIALMLAQKNSNAKIDAVEIDHNAIKDAKRNFEISPWRNFKISFSIFYGVMINFNCIYFSVTILLC